MGRTVLDRLFGRPAPAPVKPAPTFSFGVHAMPQTMTKPSSHRDTVPPITIAALAPITDLTPEPPDPAIQAERIAARDALKAYRANLGAQARTRKERADALQITLAQTQAARHVGQATDADVAAVHAALAAETGKGPDHTETGLIWRHEWFAARAIESQRERSAAKLAVAKRLHHEEKQAVATLEAHLAAREARLQTLGAAVEALSFKPTGVQARRGGPPAPTLAGTPVREGEPLPSTRRTA